MGSLISHLPPEYLKAREIAEIQKALQPELDHVNNRVQFIYIEGSLDDMTEYGIKRWEKILAIIPPAYMDLEERRFVIKSRLMAAVPYTYNNICRMLDDLIGAGGYKLTRDLREGHQIVYIELFVSNKNLYEVIYDLLDRVLSLELIIAIVITWNTWGEVKPFTWEEIKTKTWQEVLEEEL